MESPVEGLIDPCERLSESTIEGPTEPLSDPCERPTEGPVEGAVELEKSLGSKLKA